MDSWDLLSCVLLQLLPPNMAHITPILSAIPPGLQGGLLSPDIPEEQLHWRRQCQERTGVVSLVLVRSLESSSQETQGQLWLDGQ